MSSYTRAVRTTLTSRQLSPKESTSNIDYNERLVHRSRVTCMSSRDSLWESVFFFLQKKKEKKCVYYIKTKETKNIYIGTTGSRDYDCWSGPGSIFRDPLLQPPAQLTPDFIFSYFFFLFLSFFLLFSSSKEKKERKEKKKTLQILKKCL